MRRMSLSRVIAAGVLVAAVGVFVAVPACIVAVDQENGGDCLKDFDCASGLCVQGKCIAPNGDRCQTDQGCASGHCIDGVCKPVPYDGAVGADVQDTTPPADTSPETSPDTKDAAGGDAADAADGG